MTNQQLRLVIESAETGSISSAAKKYKVSQPNASMSIKKLEEELGYRIFRRIGGGISLTEQGYRFIEHAKVLLEEDQAIRALSTAEDISRLRVGVTNLNIGADAFLRFCHENMNGPTGEFTCINVSPETGAGLLKERKLDVIVSVQIKEMLPMAEKVCRENRFTLEKHGQMPICVRVRKDHPLVLDGTLDGSPNGFKALSAYPYVAFIHLEDVLELYVSSSSVPFGYSYKIYADERETRVRILQETNAYAIGCRPTRDRQERYGLVSFPTKTEGTLITYVRRGDENIRSVAEFLRILKEEYARYQENWAET